VIIEEIKVIESGKDDLRKFGLTIGIVLILLGGLFYWRGKDFYTYFFILSAFFVLTALALPVVLKPIYMAWMSLAIAIGWVMTRVILILLFYLVITPIALITRLLGKNFLDRRIDQTMSSYWIAKETKKIEKKNYEKQF
jgi:hypothetical protein